MNAATIETTAGMGSGSASLARSADPPRRRQGQHPGGPYFRTGPRARRLTRRVFGVAVLAATGWCSTGCSYSTKRPFPTDIRSVHVEMFHSKEFRRELEFRLTEALVKRIEMDTPYRVAPRETADAVLTGEILHVDNRTFGDDIDTDLPREIASTIVVRFRFQDIRSGNVLVERPRFVYQTSYIPPVGETFSKGMVRGLDGLAEQIVESLETDW